MNSDTEGAAGGGPQAGAGAGAGAAGETPGAEMAPFGGLRRPEGIAITPDGQQLWVSDRGAHCIVGYEVLVSAGRGRAVRPRRPVPDGHRAAAGGGHVEPSAGRV